MMKRRRVTAWLMAGLLVAGTVSVLVAQAVAPLSEYTVTLAEGRARIQGVDVPRFLAGQGIELDSELGRAYSEWVDVLFVSGWNQAVLASSCRDLGQTDAECAALFVREIGRR